MPIQRTQRTFLAKSVREEKMNVFSLIYSQTSWTSFILHSISTFFIVSNKYVLSPLSLLTNFVNSLIFTCFANSTHSILYLYKCVECVELAQRTQHTLNGLKRTFNGLY